MINGTSIEDIAGRKTLEPFALLEIIPVIMEIAVILGKVHRHFAPCSLADFQNSFLSSYSQALETSIVLLPNIK